MAEKARTEVRATPGETTVRMTRLLRAPPELVWETMTRPEHLRRWWGGSSEEATLAVCEIDLRPGGKWRFVERDADGHDYPFTGEFRTVEPPTRYVQTFRFDVDEWRDRICVVTTTFERVRGGTWLTTVSEFSSVADRDAFVASGAEAGMNISMDKLDQLLQRLQAATAARG